MWEFPISKLETPALSGRGSQTSRRTSGWGQSHEGSRDVASWVVPHAERPRFPGPLLIRSRCPVTSSKVTLWMKAQHEGTLTSPCIVWKNPPIPLTAPNTVQRFKSQEQYRHHVPGEAQGSNWEGRPTLRESSPHWGTPTQCANRDWKLLGLIKEELLWVFLIQNSDKRREFIMS